MTDYTKLNDRIVQQAYKLSNMTLSEELRTKLFQDKIQRAAEMLKAREQSPVHFKIKQQFLFDVNGSMAVSKPAGWGSNPWRGAKTTVRWLTILVWPSAQAEVCKTSQTG